MSQLLKNIEKRYFKCDSCYGKGEKLMYIQQAGKTTKRIKECFYCKGRGRITCDHILGEMCQEYGSSYDIYIDDYEEIRSDEHYHQHNYCQKCGTKLTDKEVFKEQSENG